MVLFASVLSNLTYTNIIYMIIYYCLAIAQALKKKKKKEEWFSYHCVT